MTITLNGTTGITSPGGDTSTSLATSGLSIGGTALGAGNATRFKNRIINGDMRIDQRNAGASQSITNGTGTYSLDRWRIFYDATSATLTSQQSTTAPSNFTNSSILTVGTAGSISASTNCTLMQYIEGLNCTDLACGTASALPLTLSFWVRSSVTGTFNASLLILGYSYVATYTINAANIFEYKTISIPALTLGTPTTPSNTTYIQARWDLGCGSTATTGSANVWTSGIYFKSTGTTSLITTAGATFYITGVQLEVGSSATGFEYCDYGTQLLQCYRYYQIQNTNMYGTIDPTNTIFNGTFVTKRTSPTVTLGAITPTSVTGYVDGFKCYIVGNSTYYELSKITSSAEL